MLVGCFNVVVCLVTLADFRKVVPVDKKKRRGLLTTARLPRSFTERGVPRYRGRLTKPATNMVFFPDMSRGKCKLTMLVAAHPVRVPFLI